jgi:hypothetical protein
MVRETMAMPAGVAERLIAVDGGRHPGLDEMRLALGGDLDLSTATAALRAAGVDFAAGPSDRALAAMLDAMYRTLSSTRMVRVDIGAAGPVASRLRGPIVIRDGEHLVLLAFADNHTDAVVEFSAEAHGEGVGGYIEARRTGSALFDAGAMHTGSYLLPVMVVAGGQPSTVDVPIECRAAGLLRVRIVDDETGEALPARVYLSDSAGAGRQAGAALRRDVHGNAWFHADGGFAARVAGTARLRIARGIEYEAWETEVAVPADGEAEREVRLRRWSHMAADGWYSGDVHVHMHYGGEYALTPGDAWLAQRAEDLHFMNMMVANGGSDWVHDAGLFEGKDHALSDGTRILRWGEEHRNDFYGHMCLYGIDSLVPPVYGGFRGTEHAHDVPSNAEVADGARAAGGTLSYAHPMFGSIGLDRVFEKAKSYEAKELPVDAALGKVDAVDIMSYPSNETETARLWYRLLNCGLRLPATAGTDTFMNMSDLGEFTSPPGGDRVFVCVDGALSTEAWCAGVRAGRTFVTNGPMLRLEVNGREIGDAIEARAGDVLRIEAEAGSWAPMERIELIVNGEIIASAAAEGARRASLSYDAVAEESCWIALRALGPSHEAVLDADGLFAHTSPIYVTVDGAPVARADDAAYFVEWIDRLIEMAAREGHYASDADRERVAASFREGQAYYRRIASA